MADHHLLSAPRPAALASRFDQVIDARRTSNEDARLQARERQRASLGPERLNARESHNLLLPCVPLARWLPAANPALVCYNM